MKNRVLVADDDEDIRWIVARMLTSAGYEVLEAADGGEAVERFIKHNPDLVLLDLHMSRLDGLAAMTEILDRAPAAKVVVFSGDGDGEHAQRALERGACDYLAKPIDSRALLTTVEVNLLVRALDAAG